MRAVGQLLHENVARNQIALLIILRQELCQHVAGGFAALAGEGKVVAADHAAAADVDQLNHGVQPVLRNGEDVLLAPVGLDGDLPFHQPLHVADFVADDGSALVLHLCRVVHHFAVQHVQYLLVVAAEERQHAVHHVPVLLFGAFSGARCEAFADFVVDARAAGCFQRQFLPARPQGEHAANCVDDLPNRRRADVWAEVLRAVLLHPPGEGQARERLFQVDAQVRIMLIVLEKDVVVRFMQLDEVAFEAQRFEVAVAQENVEVVDVGNHGGDFRRVLRVAEVGADAVFEVDRLADVDNRAVFVLHQVAAGAFGQHPDFQLQLFAPVDFCHKIPSP